MAWLGFTSERNRSRILTILLILIAVIPMPQCFLDRAGTGDPATLTASAEPALICPADPVRVSWAYDPVGSREECTLDDSEEDCPLPTVIELAPAGEFSDPSPHAVSGTQTINPEADVTVVVTGYQLIRAAGDPSNPDNRTGVVSNSIPIDVLEPPEMRPGVFPGTCRGNAPLQVNGGSPLGESIVFDELHYDDGPYVNIGIMVKWAGDPVAHSYPSITRGGSTAIRILPGDRIESIDVVAGEIDRPFPPGFCPPPSPTQVDPEVQYPNIDVRVRMICNSRD